MSGLGKTFDSNIKTRLRRVTIDTSTDQQLHPTRRGAGIKSWFSDYYSFQDQSTSISLLTLPFSSRLNPRKCTERSAYLDLALISSSFASASSSSSSSTWPSLLYFTSLVEVNQAIK